jgi:hypothetical protein
MATKRQGGERVEDKPCEGCPWLKKNQTPKAVKASPIDGAGRHWFARENIEKHWRAAGDIGAMLPCHMTDVNAPLYGGKATKAEQARICVGLSMLARREVRAFMQAGQNVDRYVALKGIRWSAVGLAAWAARLYHAGAFFVLGGRTFTMPRISPDVEDARVGLPWE